MLDHAKKLEFVHKMAKLGLQHFDGGGVISAGNSNPLSGVAGGLTAQNSYQATTPDISAETTNYNNANSGQNALAGQLQQQASGQGPNPALAQLQQTTNQNANAAASAAASNRGLNPGQAQRIASQGQVEADQTAGGQAATLSAEQQIAAQQNLANVYGQQENAASSFGNTVNQGSLGAQAINAQVSQNNANSVNQTQGGLMGGIAQGVESIFAKGGVVKMASGGTISTQYAPNFSNAGTNIQAAPTSGSPPSSGVGKFLSGAFKSTPSQSSGSAQKDMPSSDDWYQAMTAPSPDSGGGNATSDQWYSMMTNGPVTPTPMEANGGLIQEAMQAAPLAIQAGLLKSGGKVKALAPNEKATVKGDSYQNDKVPAMLSQGEIVIPRHITQGKDPVNKAAAFVRAHLAKKGLGAT